MLFRSIYNGGTTALLGALIARGTGQRLDAFARRALFDPLAIRSEWTIDDKGVARAAAGLRMTPRDLTKIGQLMLDRGVWQGRQVVPASWIEQSTTPAIGIDARRYGYHWYMGEMPYSGTSPGRARYVSGGGYGGQRLYAFPDAALVIAITAGNYSRTDQADIAARLLRDIVLPAVLV